MNQTQQRAELTSQHMKTAKTMEQRGDFQAAVSYLTSCGWHHETAARFLHPDPREARYHFANIAA